MAYTSGYMGNATSGIGQGLAFVLPEDNTAKYAMQLAQTHAQQLQDLARQQMTLRLKAQQQYEKDFKDQELPKAFAPFDTELNKRQNAWMQDGAKYYAETGKNPFNDPKFVARHNDEIVVPARKSLELGQNYVKLRSIAETDPTNKYTKESKQAVIDYQKQIEEHPFEALDKPLPRLVETPASVDDLIKTLKPGLDSHNKAQAFAAAIGDPKWHDMLRGYGYNPDLPDFGIYSDPKSPNGKRVWYTNPTFTGSMADHILEGYQKGDNASKNLLDKVGIDPKTDQFAKEKLQHLIADQNDAMGRFVTDAGRRMYDDKAEQEEKHQKFQERLETARLRLSQQEHADLQAQRKWQHEHQHSTLFMSNIVYGDEAAKQQTYQSLKKLYESNPNYRSTLQISDDGQYLNITVPPKMKKNPNLAPGQKPTKHNPEYVEVQPGYTIPPIDIHDEAQVESAIFEVQRNVGAQNMKHAEPTKEVQQAQQRKTEGIKGTNKSIWDN